MKKLFLICGGLSGFCPTLRMDHLSDISLQDRWVFPQEGASLQEGRKIWKDTPYEWRGRDLNGMPMQSFVAPIALSERELLIPTLGVGLQILDTVYQKIIWSLELSIGVAAQPLVEGAIVYVAGMDSQLYKISWKEHKILWKVSMSAESLGGVSRGKAGQLFVSTADEAVHAFSDEDGKLLWTYRRNRNDSSHLWSLRGHSKPLYVVEDDIIVMGFSDGFVTGVDASAGKLRWEKNMEARGLYKDVDTSFTYLKSSNRIVSSLPSGDVLALEPKTGKTLWRVSGGGAFEALVSADEKFLYVGTLDARVLKLDTSDGALLWQLPLQKRGLATTPAWYENKEKQFLLVNTSHGGILLLEESTGKILWENHSLTGTLAPPVVMGKDIWSLSSRNILSRYQIVGLDKLQ